MKDFFELVVKCGVVVEDEGEKSFRVKTVTMEDFFQEFKKRLEKEGGKHD